MIIQAQEGDAECLTLITLGTLFTNGLVSVSMASGQGEAQTYRTIHCQNTAIFNVLLIAPAGHTYVFIFVMGIGVFHLYTQIGCGANGIGRQGYEIFVCSAGLTMLHFSMKDSSLPSEQSA